MTRRLGGFLVALWMALVVSVASSHAVELWRITEFTIPTANSRPGGITIGPDGHIWFTELDGHKIGRLTADGEIREFDLPDPMSTPYRIVSAPDGFLWFTESDGGRIGRMSVHGAFREFPLREDDVIPLRIIVGPDGNLWFTELEGRAIGTILINEPHTIREFPIDGHVEPFGIAVGPDHRLWYTDHEGHIGRMGLDGFYVTFTLPRHDTGPTDIVSGSDGNLWFTQNSTNSIASISSFGGVTEFPLPVFAGPLGITAAQDGALWFAGAGGDLIGRITPAGTLALFPLPQAGSFPVSIVEASDGSFWFTEALGNRIGHLEPPLFCLGDCNRDGLIAIEELVRGVNVVEGSDARELCRPYDNNATLGSLVAASQFAITGCPPLSSQP